MPPQPEGATTALKYALALDCNQIHAMAGKLNKPFTPEQQRECYIRNIQHSTDVVAEHNINILIEPINTRDMPDYRRGFTAHD
ncbi:TIM barrel protein [Photorhabdus tasmaniensis]|uniref:TIM barrel protein n=1 Tax=Photorhabdus tasmaniensis TaxID=1004159 RepID=UPI001F609AD5|nr:TIM barrel protein [Photorhabdus tasmaniensis]